jgi:hypothetical protein
MDTTNELTNPAAVDFFSIELGDTDNFNAGRVLGQLLQDTLLIQQSEASHPYNPITGTNSNSVVYSELRSIGITVPISLVNLSLMGPVGVLNSQGKNQIFTGWGQNLLP